MFHIHNIFLLYELECISKNFSLEKAVIEIQENLQSEAIWYNFKHYTDSFNINARAHFHFWNEKIWNRNEFAS